MVGPKPLYIQGLRIHGFSIGQIRFSFWSFNFWPRSDFYKKRSKSAKSNPIFHLKWRRDTSRLYNFWIAQWVNFSSKIIIIFFNLAIFFWGKKGPMLDQKCKLCVSPVSVKILSFSKILEALFLFPWILSVVKILAESGNIWRS